MSSFLGTGIFWTTLAVSTATLSLSTLAGRAWTRFLPFRLRAVSRFYLAPVMGLSTLMIIADKLGVFLPLGNSIIPPLIIVALVAGVLFLERRIRRAFLHAVTVSGFGIVCGASLLGPLFVFGAFNAHNDAFTYLVHGNWLQEHAFGEIISAAKGTPFSSQVKLYQYGFRMGASYLLAMIQSLLNLRWSTDVYPGVVIPFVGATCLAVGFPLHRPLSSLNPGARLSLLAIPAFTLGGLVFGANLGFFPQTVGLALGAGLVFLAGGSIQWITRADPPKSAIVKAAIPAAVLFSGGVFAYPELTPFLVMALVGSTLVIAWRSGAWGKCPGFMCALFGFSCILLNTELLRVYSALKIQSSAVVGSPVAWNLLGYLAHAFGVHGGAWDIFQWSIPEQAGTKMFWAGGILFGLVSVIVFSGRGAIRRLSVDGILFPAVTLLILLVMGFLYFRYRVPSPFPEGFGQSWSQFKLADWAHPFAMALVLLSLIGLKSKVPKGFDATVAAVCCIGIFTAAFLGVVRIRPLMHYYDGVRNLDRFYLDFRKTVLDACPGNLPIYLNLGGRHHKFRQMAVIYLSDRYVKSDWKDDGYIFPQLPDEFRSQAIRSGDCVVEPDGRNGWLSRGTVIGPFRVGVYHGHGQVFIASATGAYNPESDGNDTWYWVEHQVVFRLLPRAIPKDCELTKLSFVIGACGDQTLTLHVRTDENADRVFLLHAKDGMPVIFDKVIDIPPYQLAELSMTTDGIARPLSSRDSRKAAWMIRNLKLAPVPP